MLKYVNHVGDEIIFNKNGIYLNESDLRDYEWKYDVNYKKITNIDNTTKKPKLPVIIAGNDLIEKANRFFGIIDKDIVEGQQGKLYVGDYYLQGYFYKSEKSKYTNGKIIKLNMGYVATGLWHKEKTLNYNVLIEDESQNQIDLDYPHDAPHDYTSPQDVRLINDNYTSSDFRFIVYGPAVNPSIIINGHEYTVYCTVANGEYLTIDSSNKKIFTTSHTGETTNRFNDRDRDSYIFEKIPNGTSEVYWNGDFSFDIVMIEDRSEPKWI